MFMVRAYNFILEQPSKFFSIDIIHRLTKSVLLLKKAKKLLERATSGLEINSNFIELVRMGKKSKINLITH